MLRNKPLKVCSKFWGINKKLPQEKPDFSMRNLILLVLCIFTGQHLFAQNEEESVKRVVQTMFVAMKNADASLLATTFSDSAIFQTIVNDKDGIVKVRNEDVKNFINFVSKEEKGNADEKIVFETIKIDGPLALV